MFFLILLICNSYNIYSYLPIKLLKMQSLRKKHPLIYTIV
jgi:hypothetical protein